LFGRGAIALTAEHGTRGRQFFGDALNLRFDGDGHVTSVIGSGHVRLELPGTKTAAPRRISARAINAAGRPGRGLDTATFSDEVVYREDATGGDAQPRVVTARALTASLDEDAITNAIFSGAVTFAEQGMDARAARVEYDPDAGTLRLAGAEQGRAPHVADQDVSIDADSIDVRLDGHQMNAKGSVKTVLQPQRADSNSKLPGLLDGGQRVNANADTLQYDGKAGSALYTGDVQIWQGETAIRADRITIDRSTGDLIAAATPGATARSTMMMSEGVTIGRAPEIRYTDATRELQYAPALGAAPRSHAADAPAAPRATPTATVAAAGPVVQLAGPQGTIQGVRIVAILQKEKTEFDRLEAYDAITMSVDTRRAAGERLTYFAADGRYVMSGVGGTPVKVVEASSAGAVRSCRETSGRTLTFFRSTDRIIVDGKDEIRTQAKSGGVACPPPTLSSPR
jgi:lipopolysaccharide export system protein LptA